MTNIEKAKDSLNLIERGENPLDNYELVKAALKESSEAISIMWDQLSPKMMESLNKDKECKKIIKEFKDGLEKEMKESLLQKKRISLLYLMFQAACQAINLKKLRNLCFSVLKT